jgi:hypothetical protein
MVYLHYRSLEDLDLPALLSAESVTVVVPRITLRELDKHKNTHQLSRIRDRARRILQKIEKWTAGSTPIRPGVVAEFYPGTPSINYAEHGLNPEWSDDVLIASVLQYKQAHADETVVLITQDSGPTLTASHLNITVLQLPEEYRLAPESDPLEIENQELSKALARLQNALPQLLVCFAGSEDPITFARFAVSPPPVSMEAEIAKTLADLKSKLPKRYPPPAAPVTEPHALGEIQTLLSNLLSIHPIPPDEYERYNREVEAFLVKYENYMRATWAVNAAARCSIQFQIEIRNIGTAPADDVDVELHFPNGFRLFSKDELPDAPEEPRPPRQPRTKTEMMTDSLGHIPHLYVPRASLPDLKLPTSFSIKRTGSYTVTDHFRRIKHGSQGTMPEMVLTFDSYESASSFNCNYMIRPANLPDPVTGQLHFVIEKPTDIDTRVEPSR